MKRAREASVHDNGITKSEFSSWTVLVGDIVDSIGLLLDPLSRILLSLTDWKNYKRLKIETTIPLIVMEEALFLHGTLRLVQTYNWRRYKDGGEPMGHAARRGDLKILKWLNERCFRINSYTLESAARYGHLQVMKWLKSIDKLYWTKQTMQQAVMHGSVENLQWMVDNGCPEPHIQLLCAIKYGNLDALRWLYGRGHCFEFHTQTEYIEMARKLGYLEIAEWIQSVLPGPELYVVEYDVAIGVVVPDISDDDI